MSSLLIDILESFLGDHRKHNDDSGQISFDCPACSYEKGLSEGDGKGNLEINYNKGVYKCWACYETNNMHGPVIRLLNKYANARIIRDYLLVKPETDLEYKKSEYLNDIILPEGYKKITECNGKEYRYDEVMYYVKEERGLTDDIIKDFEIGFTTKGKYFNRVIFPSYDKDGKLNYFVARWFSKDKKWEKPLKYLNPEAEKQEIIFNEKRINWDATIYLVEGVTDHIVIPNSIPLLGKVLSDNLLELLHDNANCNIIIVLDGDAYKDAVKLYKKLNFGKLRDRIRIVVPPEGYDPSEIHKHLGKKGIIKLLRNARKLSFDELR